MAAGPCSQTVGKTYQGTDDIDADEEVAPLASQHADDADEVTITVLPERKCSSISAVIIILFALATGFFVFTGGVPAGPQSLNPNSTQVQAFDWQLDKSPREAFTSSFAMILATELGDETFIIAAVMAMRHPKLVVLGGALSALYFMTVLAAILGVVLPNLISEETVHSCATGLYIFFGARLIWIGAHAEEEAEDKADEFKEVENHLQESDENAKKGLLRRMCDSIVTPVFLQAGIMTFIAEWGDRSQIATISLAAHQNPIGVIFGAMAGHTICTSLAVYGGEWLGKRISARVVAFGGGTLFMIFALLNFLGMASDAEHVALKASGGNK